MAGIRITDLTPLATAEGADYLCIVDVSDTSQSPEGTTKKIEVGNVFESGAFAPTILNLTGAVLSFGGPDGVYSKVGNVVTFTFSVNLDLNFSSFLTGTFSFTFPVSIGTGFAYGTAVINTAENVTAIVNNDTVTVNSLNSALILNVIQLNCTMQYFII